MAVTIILGDMLELEDWADIELHVGKVPQMVNNQSGLIFGFEDFISDLRRRRLPYISAF